MAFGRLKIYTHLRPTGYNVFSERTISSERPFRGPLKPSNQHPNPAFSDNSPYLGDSGIVFLCAVAQAIPTGVPIHRSAPACWQTAVGSNGPRPAGASSTVRRCCVIRARGEPGREAHPPQYTRSDRGIPSSAIRFSTAHLIAASTFWFLTVRAERLTPSIALYRETAFSATLWRVQPLDFRHS